MRSPIIVSDFITNTNSSFFHSATDSVCSQHQLSSVVELIGKLQQTLEKQITLNQEKWEQMQSANNCAHHLSNETTFVVGGFLQVLRFTDA